MLLNSIVMKKRQVGLLLIVILTTIGCAPKALNQSDLHAYIRDSQNGLSSSKLSDQLEMRVSYRPTDLMVYQEIGNRQDSLLRSKLQGKYKPYMYFILDLSAGDKDLLYGLSANQSSFSKNLQTLSFQMGDFIQLISANQDTVSLADYVYDRNFGFRKSSSLLLAFLREDLEHATSFNVQIREFGFDTEIQNFFFSNEHLQNVPKLKELQW